MSHSTSMAAEDVGRLRENLQGREDELIQFIERLALFESPTRDPDSQRPIQALLEGRLEAIGFRVRHLPGVETGGHL